MTEYSCRHGDAFVEGTLNGRLTVAASNDVVITWHIRYAGDDDLLGLIGNEFVEVYHPVRDEGPGVNLNAAPNHPR